jgi:release factor glutamine methyltransferase
LLSLTVSRLRDAGCVAATEEAARLAAAASDEVTLEEWVRRRERGEPLAWIIGETNFCGRKLHVAPGVYVPRVQTEELAHRAAALLPDHGRAVDLCTGAGAVAAHLVAQVPTATVVGVDIDLHAAVCARRNGVPAVVGDVANLPLPASGHFDIVTAVAPYVPTTGIRLLPSDVQRYEPRRAIDGGEDGLRVVRRVVVTAARLLRCDGWLLVEVGWNQEAALTSTLEAAGFRSGTPWRDADGDVRGIAAVSSG